MNSDQEHGAERAKQVFDKELQIVRQRELLAKLEHNDGSAAALHRARERKSQNPSARAASRGKTAGRKPAGIDV